jgi:hypothetical protein
MSNGMHRALLIAAAAACAPAAQAKVDLALERQIAGVYSNACADRAALEVKFYDDVMMVGRGGKTVTANKIRAHKNHPAASSAPDFKTVIAGDVRGGDGLVFVLYHNAGGLFAVIEGGAKSLAPLGPGVQGQRLRHCDPNRNALPGAPAPAGPAGPGDLLKDAAFKSAYMKALGPLASEPWLTRMDGPAPENRKVTIGGVEYTLAAVCKAHDCADHNMVVLYQAAQKTVVGQVQQKGRKTLLGNPAPALAKEIDKLWMKAFRGKS